MSYQQIREVVSLPPDPPRLTNNNYICKESCPKRLDQHTTAYAALVDRWEVTEYLCDQYHSSNPQQEYTRGECWRDQNGRWISCSNWDCTLRYISDRPC